MKGNPHPKKGFLHGAVRTVAETFSFLKSLLTSPCEAKNKIASQLSGEEQRKLADFVIENNGSLADLLPLKKKTKLC